MLLHKIRMVLTPYVFLGSCVLEGLKLAKNYKLAQEANKDVVYGALLGITKNPKLWRHSPVGREYSHLTVEGKEVIADLMQDLLRTIDILDQKVVEQKAREVVWSELKKEHD